MAFVLPLAFAVGCMNDKIVPDHTENGPFDQDLSEISAVCSVAANSEALPYGATKAMGGALIDMATTRQLDANFLRYEEDKDGFGSHAPYFGAPDGGVNWTDAYLSEATVISSPDNTEDIHYRSIIFSPRQVYGIESVITSEDPLQMDTTRFYHSRMVGWYPRNCDLKVKDGTQKFEASSEQDASHEIGGHTYKAVRFTGLDGSKDIMMSNVCEGQHWHSKDTGRSPHTNASGNTPYRVPFGHYLSYNDGDFTPLYSNYFKFRHYLSGVRFWGFVPEQNTHALDMWGNITDVVLLNQPTSVCITIPEQPAYDGNGNSLPWSSENFSDATRWGQTFDWGDYQNISVQTGPMFGDDTNHSGENYTVDFSNLDMRGVGDREHALYMGYSLVQPDVDLLVEIHTRYGVYVSKINRDYDYKYKDEHGVEQDGNAQLFQPGYYYDVYLSLKTDGTISTIIEQRGTERYYDLTRSVEVGSIGDPEPDAGTFKYANCYIVDPSDDQYDHDDDNICDYSGFFFSGKEVGNGDEGIFRYNSQQFYPAKAELDNIMSARLIWESSRLLVTEVELINGYIKFKVPGITDSNNYSGSTYIGPKGNAVIGVFDANDVCLWSWHVWITDTPKDIVYTSGGGTRYTYMDRNLGATYGGVPGNAGQALASYGLYYQWGRKDPSMGPATYNYSQFDGTTAPYYDYASDEQTSAIPMSLNYPTLKDAVENPMNLILPSRKSDKGYLYDWLYYEPENLLWGYDSKTGNTSKTIYDPCPYGYRVPTGEIEAVMRNSSYNRGTYGLQFTSNITGGDLFFPFAGYKGVDKSLSALSTAWKAVGQKGDYQEGVYDLTSGNTLYYRKRNYISSAASWTEQRVFGEIGYSYGTSGNCQPDNGSYVYCDWANRRTAASIRCVKDE